MVKSGWDDGDCMDMNSRASVLLQGYITARLAITFKFKLFFPHGFFFTGEVQ